MKAITRNPDSGKIEIADSRYVMDLDADEEKAVSKLIQEKKRPMLNKD